MVPGTVSAGHRPRGREGLSDWGPGHTSAASFPYLLVVVRVGPEQMRGVNPGACGIFLDHSLTAVLGVRDIRLHPHEQHAIARNIMTLETDYGWTQPLPRF
jgi:hypothetical protein